MVVLNSSKALGLLLMVDFTTAQLVSSETNTSVDTRVFVTWWFVRLSTRHPLTRTCRWLPSGNGAASQPWVRTSRWTNECRVTQNVDTVILSRGWTVLACYNANMGSTGSPLHLEKMVLIHSWTPQGVYVRVQTGQNVSSVWFVCGTCVSPDNTIQNQLTYSRRR